MAERNNIEDGMGFAGLVPRREERELDMRRSFMRQLPFCPDHRDKVRWLTCRQCEIERLKRIIRNIANGGEWSPTTLQEAIVDL